MSNDLKGKNIVLGVSGGIAAYKSIELLRLLQKAGADVNVIMTKSAAKFVTPFTFKVLSQNPVSVKMFEDDEDPSIIKHIDLAEKADAVIIAPATANVIGKLAGGIADDYLTTFMLAVTAPVIICPSMNTNMYENRIVQRNIDTLESFGFYTVEPGSGELACGVYGAGRLPEPEYILDRVISHLIKKDLKEKTILITAGPTREAIDPVRYISNHSSGKMGYAIAKAAEQRGSKVILVSGPTNIPYPINTEVISIESASQMFDAVFDNMDRADIIIKVAAVADYRAKDQAEHKIKKEKTEKMVLELEKNKDILKELGKRKKDHILVGFAAETRELEENATSKLVRKNLDMIVGNIVGKSDSGFGADTNKATFFYKDGTKESFDLMSKHELANTLLDTIKGRILQNGK